MSIGDDFSNEIHVAIGFLADSIGSLILSFCLTSTVFWKIRNRRKKRRIKFSEQRSCELRRNESSFFLRRYIIFFKFFTFFFSGSVLAHFRITCWLTLWFFFLINLWYCDG